MNYRRLFSNELARNSFVAETKARGRFLHVPFPVDIRSF